MSWIQNAITGFVNWHKQNFLSWFLLALGMCAILIFEARDVGLQTSQWFWLLVITIDVAILCVWIITWGDSDSEDAQPL